jgi:putative SOS response-associated peptidase YedK
MCGRYTLRRAELIRAAFDAAGFEEFTDLRIVPRFNIAPSQTVPIVHLHDGRRVIDMVKWGFVPGWAKDDPKVKPINAKSETVATSGLFRLAFKSSRCLLPADGFYEWRPGVPKQPYFFHRPDDALFAFAGLAGRQTCLLLTTTPNEVVKIAHNRMPAMLHESDFARWLDPASTPGDLQSLLRPYPAAELVALPVGGRVGSPVNDDPSLIEPAEESTAPSKGNAPPAPESLF